MKSLAIGLVISVLINCGLCFGLLAERSISADTMNTKNLEISDLKQKILNGNSDILKARKIIKNDSLYYASKSTMTVVCTATTSQKQDTVWITKIGNKLIYKIDSLGRKTVYYDTPKHYRHNRK